jgi:hypothetical protein
MCKLVNSSLQLLEQLRVSSRTTHRRHGAAQDTELPVAPVAPVARMIEILQHQDIIDRLFRTPQLGLGTLFLPPFLFLLTEKSPFVGLLSSMAAQMTQCTATNNQRTEMNAADCNGTSKCTRNNNNNQV